MAGTSGGANSRIAITAGLPLLAPIDLGVGAPDVQGVEFLRVLEVTLARRSPGQTSDGSRQIAGHGAPFDPTWKLGAKIKDRLVTVARNQIHFSVTALRNVLDES